MATACRKMISRYLVSTRDDTEYSENNELALYIDREELWGKKWEKDEEKIKNDLLILGKEKLTLGQSYELYNILGGDESKTMEDINVKKDKEEGEEEKDNDENENEGEERIKRKDKGKGKGKGKGKSLKL